MPYVYTNPPGTRILTRRRLQALTNSCAAACLAVAALQPAQARPDAQAGELAAGTFLVATASLKDPNFSESVVLVIEYGAQGAFGVIVNRTLDVTVSDVNKPLAGLLAERDQTLHFGGPVARQKLLALVRHDAPPPDGLTLFEGVHLTAKVTELVGFLAERPKQASVRILAGHAGWVPGQLEAEVASGAWLIAPVDEALIFDADPATVWRTLIESAAGTWALSPPVPLAPDSARAPG